MFKTALLKQKNSNSTWWMVIAIASAAMLLVFNQLNSPAVPTPAPAPAAELPQPQNQSGADTESFLDEYNPEPATFLSETEPADNRSGWEVGVDLILKLAIVLGLVFVSLRGLRWLQRHKQHTVTGGATINVLETTGLAPGRSLHLVVVGEKTLLLGATDHQITVLSELTEAVIPVAEAEGSFEQALNLQQQNPEPPLAVPTIPADDDAAEYVSDWQSTISHLRSGIRQVQQVVGG